MQELAKLRGGECLSKEYVNIMTKLMWKCKEGHIWKSMPNDVKRGHWCPYCAGTVRLTINEMQELAKTREGKCLSKRYVNNETKLTWRCKKGHVWGARPSSIKYGTWCPYCAGKRKIIFN